MVALAKTARGYEFPSRKNYENEMRFSAAVMNHTDCLQAKVESLPTRVSNKWCANNAVESLAHWEDVEPWIQTGDLALYSGKHPFSWGVRFLNYSRFSHVGLWYRDENGKLWIADVIEGRGGGLTDPLEAIKASPGQWYWAHVSRQRFPELHEDALIPHIKEMITWKYGYWGIVFQWGIHTSGLRIAAYLVHLDQWKYFEKRPFCSQSVGRVIRKASLDDKSGLWVCDPVPDRAEPLMVPQDMAQSRIWHPQKTSLFA